MIDREIDKTIHEFEQRLSGSADLVKRKMTISDRKTAVYIAYIDMLVDRVVIERQVISQLLAISPRAISPAAVADELIGAGIASADVTFANSMDEAVDAVMGGDCLLLIAGHSRGIIISAKGWPNRGVPQVETEAVVFGSKEAFSEVFRINTMLIRRRIRDSRLTLFQTKVGKRGKSDVALMYIEGVAREKIVSGIKERIGRIDIDAILDAASLGELIEDDWISPFPQAQLTERPDKAASAILEGRIAVIVDNSPFVLLLPATLNVFFQASDDYYQGFHISSLVRVLRYAAAFLALALPGLYLACAVFHPGMLPMLLIFKMAGARQSVPFPAFFEILLMELSFELLREAGVRLPKPVGGSIGIIGGLILGQAAVEAGLVSPIVVIVVAATGIAGFTIPNYALQSAFRFSKYLITALSAVLGLLGFWLGIILLLIHLASLKSFGIPYLFPFVSPDVNEYNDLEDSVVRLPLFRMKKRPVFSEPGTEKRLIIKRTKNAFKERD